MKHEEVKHLFFIHTHTHTHTHIHTHTHTHTHLNTVSLLCFVTRMEQKEVKQLSKSCGKAITTYTTWWTRLEEVTGASLISTRELVPMSHTGGVPAGVSFISKVVKLGVKLVASYTYMYIYITYI
jgi:hypothetical protein